MESDDDDFEPVKMPKMSFESKSWKCAQIDMKYDNGWMTFIDKTTNRPLNQPQLKSNDEIEKKTYYKYKGYQQVHQKLPANPLDFPVRDNYTAIYPRRKYGNSLSVPRDFQFREPTSPQEPIPKSKNNSTHYFIGDNPYKNPFRISTAIINERRMAENKKTIETRIRQLAPKTHRGPVPSLFERSLQKQKKEYVL